MEKRKNKHVILINPDKEFEPFPESLQNKGIKVDIVHTPYSYLVVENDEIELFFEGKKISLEDAYFFFRSWGVDTRDKHFTSILAEHALKNGLPLSSEIFRCNSKSASKITQAIKFAASGIAHPSCMIMRQRSYRKNRDAILEKINFPCVLKRTGSEGNVVWKINSLEELEERVKKSGRNLFIIQEYIANDFDVRVLVFEGEVLGAIKRSSIDGFYNNVAKGGQVSVFDLDDELKQLALSAAKATDLNFAGVDLLFDSNGKVYVLEVNRSPQIRGFAQVYPDFISRMASILSGRVHGS